MIEPHGIWAKGGHLEQAGRAFLIKFPNLHSLMRFCTLKQFLPFIKFSAVFAPPALSVALLMTYIDHDKCSVSSNTAGKL